MHLGGRVIKMVIICQRMVIWLQRCADMIAKILTFHLIPNVSHLEHIEHCYKVIIAWWTLLAHGLYTNDQHIGSCVILLAVKILDSPFFNRTNSALLLPSRPALDPFGLS